MSWTVACFCGNVYTAPPDRCDACGSTLSEMAPGDASTPDAASAGVPPVRNSVAIPAADLRVHHAQMSRARRQPLSGVMPASMFDSPQQVR